MYLLAWRVVSSKGFILFRWLDGSGAEAPPHLMVWTCSRADKHCVTGILLACWSFGVGVNVYTATNTKPINELVDFDGVFLVPSQRLLGILFYWQCCIYLDPVLWYLNYISVCIVVLYVDILYSYLMPKYFQDESCGIEKEEGRLSLPPAPAPPPPPARRIFWHSVHFLHRTPHPSHCLSRDMWISSPWHAMFAQCNRPACDNCILLAPHSALKM